MDWDDLRFVRALGAHRTLEAAGNALKVAPSTVFRRLNKIEHALDVRLFLRGRDGFQPTGAGADILATADNVADRIAEMELHVAGNENALGGLLRLTTTDTLLGCVVDCLPSFRATFSNISVELIINPSFLSLSRREADIAIRPTNAPPENLVGRRIGQIRFSVYQAVDTAPFDRRDRSHWIAYDDTLSLTAGYRWMRKQGLQENPALSCNSIIGIQEAARRGLGLAVLPDYLARPDDGLMLVNRLPEDVTTELWILTHPDLRNAQRIRVSMDHFATRLKDVV